MASCSQKIGASFEGGRGRAGLVDGVGGNDLQRPEFLVQSDSKQWACYAGASRLLSQQPVGDGVDVLELRDPGGFFGEAGGEFAA